MFPRFFMHKTESFISAYCTDVAASFVIRLWQMMEHSKKIWCIFGTTPKKEISLVGNGESENGHSMRPAWSSFKILSFTFFGCELKIQTSLIPFHSIWRWKPSLKPFNEYWNFCGHILITIHPPNLSAVKSVGKVWHSLFPVIWTRLTSFDWSCLIATMCRCRCCMPHQI